MKISVDGWLARHIRRSSDQVDATNQAAVDRDALLQRQNALSHEVRDDRGLPRAQYTAPIVELRPGAGSITL